ncbi:MAG TPA: hypothetical protein VFU77_02705, partial [Steroidobacteraceae bacterium]|nr:hypothetical protein [Steroidobacteraceae bacterium]
MPWPARRWVRWALAGVAALLLAALALATWLVTTEAGLARAVALAESLVSIGIRVEGARGRLIGPLAIDAVAIEHPRASIRVAGLEADYEPLEILAGRISAEGVKVAEASVTLRQSAPTGRAPSFMPGRFSVVLDDATVSRLRVVSPAGVVTLMRDIRGSAKLSKSRIDFEDVGVRAEGWAVAGASGSLFARQPLALEVTTGWSLADDGRVAGIAQATGDLARLRVDARLARPATGRVRAEVRDLATALAWSGRAEIDSLDLAEWMEKPPLGPLAANLDVEGTRDRFAAKGVVRGAGLPEGGVRVDARAGYAAKVVSIESVALEAEPGLSLRASGTLALADEPRFDATASWTNLRWPLAGRALVTSPRGSASAEGWTGFAYRVAGEFRPAGAPPFSGEANGRFTASAIAVDASSWRTLGGNLTARGSLGRGAQPDWRVTGRARGIDPSRIRKGLPGRLTFDFAGHGTGFEPDGPWFAEVRKLSGEFRGQRASGGGAIRRGNGRTDFQDVKLILGPARFEADGSLGRGADLDARLVSDNLSAILPELGGRVDATVTVRERTVGLAFTGHDLAYGAHRAVVLSADARVDREGREHSWLRLRSSGLTIAGLPITDTRLSLDGLPKDHQLAFRVGVGQDAAALRGRGSYDDGTYSLVLEDIVASGPRIVPWRLQSTSRLTVGREVAALEPLCVAYETRRLCVQGRWQAHQGWSVKATTEAFPLEALDPKRLGAPRYQGLLVVDAEASARAGEPWVATVRAEIRDAELVYQSASGEDRTVALGLTRITLDSDAARHRLGLRVTDAEALDLAVSLEADRIAGAKPGELPLRGTVRGRTRQLALLPLLVNAIDNASGELALDFTVAGKVAAPELEG